MEKFFSRHWQTLVICSVALLILWLIYIAAPANIRFNPWSIDNPFFVQSGKWAIRFLLISLACTPLVTLTGTSFWIKVRKPAGLIAFGFAVIHASMQLFNGEGNLWERISDPRLILLGVLGFIILASLAATSFKFTMRWLGKRWKQLHRLVYVAGLLVITHSILAAMHGKRYEIGGKASSRELGIYLVILILLLLLRLPPIRDFVKKNSPLRRNNNINLTIG